MKKSELIDDLEKILWLYRNHSLTEQAEAISEYVEQVKLPEQTILDTVGGPYSATIRVREWDKE